MKLRSFDRTTVRSVGERIQDALDNLASELGITVRYTGGRFSADNATLRLELAIVDGEGNARTKDRQDFIRYAPMFGLDVTDLGKKFVFRKEEYEISGLARKSYKYPVLAKRTSDGKVFKFPVDAVKR